MAKKKDEEYVLTVKGFIFAYLFERLKTGRPITIDLVEDLLNSLYVFLQERDANAIIFEKGKVFTGYVEKREK